MLALAPSLSSASLYVLGQVSPYSPSVTGGHPFVARTEAEALEMARIVFPLTTWSAAPSVVLHACKPGGWWALITVKNGEPSGACNHVSRVAAKTAARESCSKKAACAAGPSRGFVEVYSGYDDPAFKPLETARAIAAWRQAFQPQGSFWTVALSRKFEYCIYSAGGQSASCMPGRDPLATAPNAAWSMFGDQAPFDLQNIVASPWDKKP